MWVVWRKRITKDILQKQLEATIAYIDRVQLELNSSGIRSFPLSASAAPADGEASASSAAATRQREAPSGLEKQYRELYSLLRPCLVERQPKSNVAALLMGLRGSGKTLLLERCLEAFQRETNGNCGRIIRLNGLLVRGDDVGFVVNEIVRQLSEMAVAETQRQVAVGADGREQKRARREEVEVSKLLRLRNSSFTSNLALLDEALKLACVDSIPILIVLDEMDAFLGSKNSALEGKFASEGAASTGRQLLLYHLLDRVATQGSFLSLVGITSHLATVGILEKRVKSRAEGTSKVIYVRPLTSFQGLVQTLLSKFNHGAEDENTDSEELSVEVQEAARMKKSMSDILLAPPTPDGDSENVVQDKGKGIRDVLERQYKLGMDVRWFCRVVSLALSLYAEDCNVILRRIRAHKSASDKSPADKAATDTTAGPQCPSLESKYFVQGLAAMGVFVVDEGDDDPSVTERVNVANPRLQSLYDLSGPQLAVVFSARRIIARDAQQEETPKPLTLERILNEYQTYRGSSNRHHRDLLVSAFVDLMDSDVLRPSADHSGGGPLQYDYSRSQVEMDHTTICRMPLHFPIEIDRELGEALKGDSLDCSTALREWAKKVT